jgi:hypothetical protein
MLKYITVAMLLAVTLSACAGFIDKGNSSVGYVFDRTIGPALCESARGERARIVAEAVLPYLEDSERAAVTEAASRLTLLHNSSANSASILAARIELITLISTQLIEVAKRNGKDFSEAKTLSEKLSTAFQIATVIGIDMFSIREQVAIANGSC